MQNQDCERFRTLVFSFPIKLSENDIYKKYINHINHCEDCMNIYLKRIIIDRGYNPDDFCCLDMADKLTFVCDDHPKPGSCHDYVIIYLSQYREYCIRIENNIHQKINCCPWCGVRLPDNLTEKFFSELSLFLNKDASLLDSDDFPPEFKSDEWWKKRGL
jgi:hypothetical protein